MENKKLTQEELQQVTDIQNKYQAVSQELGNIELQRIALKARKQAAEDFLLQLQQEEKQVAESIQEKYGKGTLNINTGDFTPIEEEVEEK